MKNICKKAINKLQLSLSLFVVFSLMAMTPAVVSASEELFDCGAFENEIAKNIAQLGSCERDEDCKPYSFGCPWQLTPCHFSVISTSDEESNRRVKQKISKHESVCGDRYTDRCKVFNEQLQRAECTNDMGLSCISGQCMTRTEVIMRMDGEGVDAYGSKAILALPDMLNEDGSLKGE